MSAGEPTPAPGAAAAPPLARRRRGGQPGNVNGLRHGFYSRQFRSIELSDLDSLAVGLESEIAMLRVQIRRFLELIAQAETADQVDLDLTLKTLSALGVAAQRVGRLVQANRILAGQDNEMDAASRAALFRVYQEQGL